MSNFCYCKKQQFVAGEAERGCDLEVGLCMTVMTVVWHNEREHQQPSFKAAFLSPVGGLVEVRLHHPVGPGHPLLVEAADRGSDPVVNCFLLRSKLRRPRHWESGPEGPTRPTRPELPSTPLVHTAARHRPAPPLIGNNIQASLSKTSIVQKEFVIINFIFLQENLDIWVNKIKLERIVVAPPPALNKVQDNLP